MMKRASKPKAGSMGTRIQTMNNAMILIACILCTLLIYVTILVSSRYIYLLGNAFHQGMRGCWSIRRTISPV